MENNTPTVIRTGARGRPVGSVKPRLTEEQKMELVKSAATNDVDVMSRAIANNNNALNYETDITDAHMEIVIMRVASGETLRSVCESLKIKPALVRYKAYRFPEWGETLREARMLNADECHEKMIEVAHDVTKTVAERRLIVETLEKISKVHNRAVYGDKVQIDQRQVIINLTGDDMDLG